MKKNSIVALCMLMLGLSMTARILSPEQALHRAFGNTDRSRSTMAAKLVSTLTDSKGHGTIYIMNRGDKGMILSASDAAPALLGYLDEPIDYDKIPTQMADLMREYIKQISFAESIGVNAEQVEPNDKKHSAIEPLLKTAWGQEAPYNSKCPLVNGARAVTGCLPTAMAQVMAYHGWPERGEGVADYTLYNGQRLTMNFEDVAFEWDKMKYSYEYDTPVDKVEAAAVLMVACGYSVHAEYGFATSAYTPDAAKALIENFKYDKGCKTVYQSEVENIEAWDDLIYENLSNGMPVIYRGSDENMGHAFVCDGYKDGLFHFDWGWRGICNGYFRTTALIPYSNSETDEYPYGNDIYYNFYNNNCIVSGICPADGRENPIKGGASELYSYHVFMSGQGAGISLSHIDEMALTGRELFYFEDFEGRIYFLEADSRSENRIILDKISVPDGWYITGPAIKDESGETRKMSLSAQHKSCYCLELKDGNVTGYQKYDLIPELTELNTGARLHYGEPYVIKALATNNTPMTIYAELTVAFCDVKDGTIYHKQRGRTYVKLFPGESKEVEACSLLKFNSTNEFIPGDYLMKVFCVKGNSMQPIAEKHVSIDEMERAEFTDVLIPEYFYGIEDYISLQTDKRILGIPRIKILRPDTQEEVGSLYGKTEVIDLGDKTRLEWRGVLKGSNANRLSSGKYVLSVKAMNLEQAFDIEVNNPFEIEMAAPVLNLMKYDETSLTVKNLTDRMTEGMLYLLMNEDGVSYLLNQGSHTCIGPGESQDINIQYFVPGHISPGEKIVEARLELNTTWGMNYSQSFPVRIVEANGIANILPEEDPSTMFSIDGLEINSTNAKPGLYILKKKGEKCKKLLKR